MKKCYGCNWFTDKCKNPNSRNHNYPAHAIYKCLPSLIDKSKKSEIVSHKRADDSI